MNAIEDHLDIDYWTSVISGKLFNEYVYKENYTKEKAISAISNCVGFHFLLEIFQNNEDLVINKLASKGSIQE